MDEALQQLLESVLGSPAGVFGVGVGIGLVAAWRFVSEDEEVDIEKIKQHLAENEIKTAELLRIMAELAKKVEERA